jgi:DNA-binding NarL/FixJ family response regulator
VRVVVLYAHALLGQGLERLLAAEGGLDVRAVDVSDDPALGDALASDPDVIVFEEGGRVEALELMRRTRCPLLIDVNIATSDAWTIRRDAIRTSPEGLFEVILGACLRGPDGIGADVAIPIVPQTTERPERGRSPLPAPG